MAGFPLQIFDETLRDGEQQAGLCYPAGVKRRLALQIARTGVHRIDLMPAVDPSEGELAASLVRDGLAGRLSAATMLGSGHLEAAVACGLRRVILFYAVSDRLLFLRDSAVRADPVLSRKTVDDRLPAGVVADARERALSRIVDNVRRARGLGLGVDFAAEDASRADPEFLVRVMRALSPLIEHFMLCDTVGVLTPNASGKWLREVRSEVPEAALAVHFHNDQGLALDNTIEAILAGAVMVSGTFRGIGERAGNVALEQVLAALRARHGIEVDGIDYEEVDRIGGALDELGLKPALPFSPAAHTHVSGVHVQALLQDRKSYSVFPDAPVHISFGKVGGASNFQYLFERVLRRPQSQERYRSLSQALKRRSVSEGRCYSEEEVLKLLERGDLAFDTATVEDL